MIATDISGLSCPDQEYSPRKRMRMCGLPRCVDRLPRRIGIARGQPRKGDGPIAGNVVVRNVPGRAVQRLIGQALRREVVAPQRTDEASPAKADHLYQNVMSGCRLTDHLMKKRGSTGQVTCVRVYARKPQS